MTSCSRPHLWSSLRRPLFVQLLNAFGTEVYVDEEDYLDMATALSGTGPAYAYLIMEAMVDAGVHMGLSRELARELVLQTMKGSTNLALASGQHLAQLRNNITSPGMLERSCRHAPRRIFRCPFLPLAFSLTPFSP